MREKAIIQLKSAMIMLGGLIVLIGLTTTATPAQALTGDQLVKTYCGMCHGLTVNGHAETPGQNLNNSAANLGKTASAWVATIQRMIGYGCLIPNNPTDIQAAADYLATYGVVTTTTAPPTTTTKAPTTTTAPATAGLPSQCGMCHNLPGKGTSPKDLCSPTFDATKMSSMSGFTGGAVSVAQIQAAKDAACGGSTATTAASVTTTTKAPVTTTTAAPATAGLPSQCGMCHNLPGKGTSPKDLCSPTFDATKMSSMSGFTGGAVSVAQIQAAKDAACATTATTAAPTTTAAPVTTTTKAPATTTTAAPATAGLPSQCGMCHNLPGKGTSPKDLCSPTFDATKMSSMSGFTGGAVSVAQIQAAKDAACSSTATTAVPGVTTTTAAGATTTRPANTSVMFQLYGWTDTRKQHRSYAERHAITECAGCHSVMKGVPSNNPAAPSCFTCHGQKWDSSTSTTSYGSTTTRPAGGGVMFQLYGWTDTRKQHRSYAERHAITECAMCHSVTKGVPSNNPAAPSCFTCHGQKWDTPSTTTSGSSWGSTTTRPAPTTVMYQLYGWTDARKQHRSYAERHAITECATCHSVTKGVPSNNPAAPSCFTCHGQKWDTPSTTTSGSSWGSTTTRPAPTTVMYQLYGWTDARKEHRSYVERSGVSQCVSCHSVWSGVPSPNPAAPSCYTCHGQKWNSTPPKPTTTTTVPAAITTTTAPSSTGTTTAPAASLPSNCSMCHNLPGKGTAPRDLCSSTFTAAKRTSMASMTGGAVTVATIEAAVKAICGALVP